MRRAVKLVVMGLPKAGKTTFLAALWHLLLSNEVKDSLFLAELQPSREHLNAIATLWRQWKALPRTTLPKERVVTINLQVPNHPEIYELAVPDASGEAFRRIFETRRCSNDFHVLASEAEAVILFVHPAQAIPPKQIDIGIDKLSELLDGPSLDADTNAIETPDVGSPAGPAGEPLKWSPRYAACQAKLVDLLQISRRIRGNAPLRLAVVISAWDLCDVENLNPANWIAKRLPLLHQYLTANVDVCPYDIYGISAQGAELKNPGTLVDAIRSSDRIKVDWNGTVSSDLSLPIRRLLHPDEGAA